MKFIDDVDKFLLDKNINQYLYLIDKNNLTYIKIPLHKIDYRNDFLVDVESYDVSYKDARNTHKIHISNLEWEFGTDENEKDTNILINQIFLD